MFAGFRRLLTVPGDDDGFDTKSLCVYKQGESVSSEEGRETKARVQLQLLGWPEFASD